MKVFLKKQTSILEVPENNSVNLVEITRDGYFQYDVTYDVDPRAALQNNAVIVKILASTKPKQKESLGLFTNNNPEIVLKNILQKTSLSKDKSRSQKANIFFSYNSDISAKIPNDKTSFLKPSLSDLLPNNSLTKERVLKLKEAGDITDENLIMPVLETNIAGTFLDSALTQDPLTTKIVSFDMIYKKSKDPAAIAGARTNTIQSAKKVSAGVLSLPSKILKKSFLTEKEKVSLVGNLINGQNPSIHTELPKTDFVNVLVNQPKNILRITETLLIPIDLINFDEFYFILQLTDKTGLSVQEVTVNVPHSKNVANLQIPTIPPLMEVLQTGLPGKNVINVKQMDPTATGIAIYRKENKPNLPNINSAYVLVGKIDTVKGNDFQRYEDYVNNFNPIVYRAIPYNSNNTLASEFTAKVTEAIKIGKRKKEIKRNFVSLAATTTNNGIIVEVRDIPTSVCFFKILRKEKSRYEKEAQLVGNIVSIVNEESQSAYYINDLFVKKERIYEYSCELIYENGSSSVSPNKILIKYNPIANNIVSTTVSTPTINQLSGDFDATFTLESKIIPTKLDQIKQTLQSQGLLNFFQDSVVLEKEKLEKLIAYGITRTNLTTGEVEDFGVITEKSFSDKLLGATAGVKPLEPGFEYKYSINTFFRNVETTLEEAERTVEVRQNVSYTFKPARWLHPYTLKSGTLVTETSLKKNHSESVFSFGGVGDMTSTTVSLTNILPSVSEARCQKLGKNAAIVEWRIQGNVQKIDHFIITLEMLGMKTIVGKSHNISESNYFQFIDLLQDGEHGKIKYTIVPVYYDFSRGTETVTNEVIV